MADKAQKNDAKPEKKFYQKWWVWAIAVVVLIIVFAPKDTTEQSSNIADTPEQNTTATQPAEESQPKQEEPKVPAEYKSALSQANTYANVMHLSKKGVYDQLVSEYGGKFKPEAAQYAIDNVKADWNANALAQAKTYQNDLHLSPAAVRDQLISEYGGKFTAAEADYAIEHLND